MMQILVEFNESYSRAVGVWRGGAAHKEACKRGPAVWDRIGLRLGGTVGRAGKDREETQRRQKFQLLLDEKSWFVD